MTESILKQSVLQSHLESASLISPKGQTPKRNMSSELLLTALVDAFSILVIFLLMSFSSTGDLLLIGKDTELPKAARGDLLERNFVVKLEQDQIFLENKVVPSGDGLVAALLDLRKEFQAGRPGEEFPGVVTVQADRRTKYELLNQIVLACAHAGFSDIRFAVLAK